MHRVTMVWDAGCELGEGPIWSVSDQALWFVDIKGGAVLRYSPSNGDNRRWPLPLQPGFALPADDGQLVAGTRDGLYRFGPRTGEFTLLQSVEDDRPGNRLNDATVAPDGSVWFGSMDNAETAPTGRLLRWDGTAVTVHDDGYVITNGPALCPDGRTFYHTDTLRKRVYAFDHDAGHVRNRRVFLDLIDYTGYPDGSTVDAQGGLWIGFFGAGCARRFDATGRLTDEVTLPVTNVTKVALGGPTLTTAYVTTARWLLPPDERTAQPLAGALFAFDVDIPGVAQPLVAARW